MLVIEYDGREFHAQVSAFHNDAKRRNQMRIAGYTVLVFTAKSTDHEIVDTVTTARFLATSVG